MFVKLLISIMVISFNFYFVDRIIEKLRKFWMIVLLVALPLIYAILANQIPNSIDFTRLHYDLVLLLSLGYVLLRLIFNIVMLNNNEYIDKKVPQLSSRFNFLRGIALNVLFNFMLTVFQLLIIWSPNQIDF